MQLSISSCASAALRQDSRSRSPPIVSGVRSWEILKDADRSANITSRATDVSYVDRGGIDTGVLSGLDMELEERWEQGKEILTHQKPGPELVSALARTEGWPFSASPAGLDVAVGKLLASNINLQTRDEDGHTALLLASAHRHGRDAVRRLLEARADVHECDSRCATPLIWAAGFGRNVFCPWQTRSLEKKNTHVEVVRALVEQTADVESRDSDGLTPLMAASQGGSVEVVQVLLEARAHADLSGDLTGSEAGSALSLAQAAGHNHIVHLLLTAAAAEVHRSASMLA